MHHPVVFFSRSHEHAIIHTGNPYIVSGHMLCAAAELPLREEADAGFSGNLFAPLLAALQKAASSKRRPGDGYTQAGAGQPMR